MTACTEEAMLQETQLKPEQVPDHMRLIRLVIAIVVVITVAAYILGIVVGWIPTQQKLSAADVGLIVVAGVATSALLRPDVLHYFTRIKLGIFEADLRDLREGQLVQQKELDDIRLVLTLLVQRHEQNHLENLEKVSPVWYEGNHNVRSELRRLRTLGLIQNLKDRGIGEFKDGTKHDLKEIVQLTERGKYYLERVRQQVNHDV
jgi:hypothetical protein